MAKHTHGLPMLPDLSSTIDSRDYCDRRSYHLAVTGYHCANYSVEVSIVPRARDGPEAGQKLTE